MKKRSLSEESVIIVLTVLMIGVLGVFFSSVLEAADWVQINRTPGGTFRDAVYAAGRFVAVGDAGLIWTSTDGLSWTQQSAGTTENFYKITYGAGLYVAVGVHGQIYTSPNGATWTQRNPPTGDSLVALVYNGSSQFVTAGVLGRLMTSPNGITWTDRNRWTGEEVDAMCYGNGLYIAVTSGGSVYRSSNGLDWTTCNLDTGVNNKGAIYTNGMYIVGGGANGYSVAYYSLNGINWTKCKYAITNYFMDFDYDGGHIISCGNSDGFGCSMIMTSVNGITWYRDRTPDYSTLLGCASSSTRSVAVGTRRLIITNTASGLGDGVGCDSTAARVTLTSPNGGENFASNKTYNIQWTSANITGNIKITLWKNKQQIGVIADNVPPSPGSYAWPTGEYIGGKAPTGSGYMIIVEDTGTGAADMSDAGFTIYDPPPLIIVSPNGGETATIGSVQFVVWESFKVTNNLRITLWKDNVFVGILANKLTPDRTFFVWSAGRLAGGATVPAGSGYKVKIEERGTVNYDFSNSSFTISSSPAIVVNSPGAGETLYTGENYNITWNATNISGNLRLTLWKDAVQLGIIADDISPAAGSYNWTVGNYIGGTAVGVGYRVKIEEKGTSIFGASNGPFMISYPSVLTVISPDGGENLSIGSTTDIMWNAPGIRGAITISLWKDGSLAGIIARHIDPSRVFFRWTIGTIKGGIVPAGTGYAIKIEEEGTSFSDISNSTFTITE